MVGVFERVYETGPVFRAEPHDTVRHLAEYVSLDAELGFVGDHRDVMVVLRARSPACRGGQEHGGPAAARLGLDRPRGARFPASTSPTPGAVGATRGRARPGPGPRAVAGGVGARRARLRLPFVDRVPDGEAAVLHPPAARPPAYSNSFDLLFRGLELVTGGQRLHRYEDYVAALAGARRGPAATRATSTPSGTACRRTAASRSAWSGGRAAGRRGERPGGHAFPRDLNRLTP